MHKIKRRKARPGERFLGGSGVVLFRGVKPKRPPVPADPEQPTGDQQPPATEEPTEHKEGST